MQRESDGEAEMLLLGRGERNRSRSEMRTEEGEELRMTAIRVRQRG